MLDSHFHLDQYPDPRAIAAEAARRDVFIVAVTNLPSHFRLGIPHVRHLARVRLALGLHPLAIKHHQEELPAFAELLAETSFVGEIGLDFSRAGKATADRQVETLAAILRLLARTPKFITLHSRGAEAEVASLLREVKITGAVFHWYTGSTTVLDAILADGHFVSVNPAMVRNDSGRRILQRVPRERILTETDGPHVKIGRVPTKPWDVALVEEYLADAWGTRASDVRAQVWGNFRKLVSRVNASSAE